MSEAGVVIVTHQSAEEIGPCLDAALPTGADIVVVDNASTDDTRREVARRNVRLIANTRNRGFAAAVNQGIGALDTPVVLLLNPDAHLQTGVSALIECCRAPGVGGASGKLVDAAGQPQRGFAARELPSPAALIFEALLLNRLWPSNPVNWHYRCLGFDFCAPGYVEQPAGAFLMIRRDVWEELGGFDEEFYPLWFEDVDFCWRVKDKGYRIRYTPEAVAKHTGGHSATKISLENRQVYWYRGLLRLAAKRYRSGTYRIVCLAVVIGSLLRCILGIAAYRSLKPLAAYSRVMALAGRQFARPAV